jgi:hypothetical protein
VNNVKFLHVISPEEFPIVTVRLSKVTCDTATSGVRAQVEFVTDDVKLAKLSLSFNLGETNIKMA